MNSVIEILFWISAIIIFYTYIGYGIIMLILVKIKDLFVRKRDHNFSEEELPSITLLIAAYNEASIIEEKMKNCDSLKYPKEKFQILWVIDGSNDNSNELLKNYTNVKVCYSPERKGKTAALNHGITMVETDYVVFTDANTILNENAIYEIAQCFADDKVGCVAGEKRIIVKDKDGASSGGEGLYWKYESKLKELDSRLYSAVGAAGELFAIKTSLYRFMPEDTLLDDFMLSMQIAKDGYIIKYCSDAFACETGSVDLFNEQKRKVRISAGGLQSIYRLLPLLNIFKYGLLSFEYISHRVLRWTITPVLFFMIFPLNLYLALFSDNVIYKLIFIAQLLFYFISLLGYSLRNKEVKRKSVFVPLYFIFMNLNVIKAVPYLIKNKGKGSWEKAKRIYTTS